MAEIRFEETELIFYQYLTMQIVRCATRLNPMSFFNHLFSNQCNYQFTKYIKQRRSRERCQWPSVHCLFLSLKCEFSGSQLYMKVGLVKLVTSGGVLFIWSVFCALSLPENHPRGVLFILQYETSPHRVCVQMLSLLIFMPSVRTSTLATAAF